MRDGPDDRPQQFKAREAELHEVRKRMHDENRNWVISSTTDIRDMRPPQLLGETLLRMRRQGRLSVRHDLLEEMRSLG